MQRDRGVICDAIKSHPNSTEFKYKLTRYLVIKIPPKYARDVHGICSIEEALQVLKGVNGKLIYMPKLYTRYQAKW